MPARPGYRRPLALRHLVGGALRPVRSAREALAAGIGEIGRLSIFALYAATLGLIDPETNAIGRAALANVFDGSSPLEGVLLLAIGAAIIGGALFATYWIAAVTLAVLCAGRPTWEKLASARSAIALGVWFALLPTVLAKLVALFALPPGVVTADPPSLYTSIEIVAGIPYLAACLHAVFGIGPVRAALTALFVNGGFYLAVVFLYLVAPS